MKQLLILLLVLASSCAIQNITTEERQQLQYEDCLGYNPSWWTCDSCLRVVYGHGIYINRTKDSTLFLRNRRSDHKIYDFDMRIELTYPIYRESIKPK